MGEPDERRGPVSGGHGGVPGVDRVVGLDVADGLVDQERRGQVGTQDPGRPVGHHPRDRQELGQHRREGFVDRGPVVHLVAVLPREVGSVLLELLRRRRRQPSGRRGRESQLDQRAGNDGIVHPQRQREVVDRHHRFQSVRTQRVEHRPVVGDLVLIGERVESLQVRQADGAVLVGDVHHGGGVGEDAAPLDADAEGIHAEFVAGQRRVALIGHIRPRPVLGDAAHEPEQPVQRVVHPAVPVRSRVDR